MSNHFHIVVGASEHLSGADVLKDFKSYGSRILNEQCGRPSSGTWWTTSGSKRKLPNSRSVEAAIQYVMEQEYPLVLFRSELP